MRKIALALCMIGLLAGASLGCIGREGQLAIYLTGESSVGPQTSLGLQQVNVEVTEVALRESKTGQFLTLSSGSRTYELVGLETRLSLLGLADALDEGTYDAVRITFSQSRSSVITAGGRLSILAVEPTVLTIPALIRMQRDTSSDVTLVIDVDASVTLKGNGQYVLRPVIRQGLEQ